MKNTKPTIGIIGGTGKMGQWFKSFFETQHIVVLISGRNTTVSTKELVTKADIIIVCVPIAKTQDVLKEIAPLLHKEQLLTDFTSFKVMPLETMKKTKAATLGMHPLFGPSATRDQKLKIVFCHQKDNAYVSFLKDLFIQQGIEVIKLSAEEHDYQMAYIQAFTHAMNLLYAKIIFEQENMLENKLLTPIFALQSLVMGRVLHQDLGLMSDIQFYNPYFVPVLEAFIEQAKNLATIIEKEDEKGFIQMFTQEKALAKNFSNFSTLQTNKILQQVHATDIVVPTKIPVVNLTASAKIAFLGPEGTFSHQAATMVFPKATQQKKAYGTFFDIFKAVLNNDVDCAIVPAENSIEGTVRETLDYLIDFSVNVAGSVDLPIQQQLLSKEKKLSDIYTVISHPQALAQCKLWLQNNLPNAKRQSALSTTAELVNPQKGYGYIASTLAAKQYNLAILAKNIEDNKANTTKFYIITKKPIKISGITNQKTLLFLTVYNRVGILRDILDVFAKNDINLSKLESRPSKERLWDYHFFIEADKPSTNASLTKALTELEIYCPIIRVLGQT